MKVAVPQNNTEIAACIMSLTEEVTNAKEDIVECKEAIVAHANEAREANRIVGNKVADLQFSVGSMKINITSIESSIIKMQANLETLMAFSASISTIGKVIVVTSKIVAWACAIAVAVIGIYKFFS